MIFLLVLIAGIMAMIYMRLWDIYQAIEYKGTMLDDNSGWLEPEKPTSRKKK